jgi:molecular chaperone GrpE
MKDKKKDTKAKLAKEKTKTSEAEVASKIEIMETELAESKDKFARLFAEFDNYKKRTARERLELMNTANLDVLQSMIPVLDDFERALKATENEKESEGLVLIQNKLKSILNGKGLIPLNTEVGADFDLDMHEAITTIPAPEKKLKGKVVDVVEKGYKLGDKIIRYAKVVIGE